MRNNIKKNFGRGFSRNKKGLSPVIASVLLILLVIVLATLVFVWAQGFLKEQVQKFGKPIADSCKGAVLGVEKVSSGSNPITLELANKGNVNIASLSIKLVKGGDSKFVNIQKGLDVGASMSETISPDIDGSYDLDKIVVYPVLIGNVKGKTLNKLSTCMNQGYTIQL